MGSIKIQNSEDIIYIIKLVFMLLQENVYLCRISREISQKSIHQTGYRRSTEAILLLFFLMMYLDGAENYRSVLTLTTNVTLGSYKE